MKIIILIMIMPEIFFIFRNKFSFIDQLTLLRSVILVVYGWVISPYLIVYLGIYAGIIMLLFTMIVTYIFIIVIGNKNKKSIFISIINYLCKSLFSLYRGIILMIVFTEQKIFGDKKVPKTLRLIFVNKQPLFSGAFFILEPYLLLVEYIKIHKDTTSRKFWLLLLTSHIIAVLVWMLITFNYILKAYYQIGIF